MKMRKPAWGLIRIGLLTVLIASPLIVWAQRGRQQPRAPQQQLQTAAEQVTVYQLSGMVINEKNGNPVPFARVRVGTSRRATTANADGFFSLPVVITDTLNFYSIGYQRTAVVFRDYLTRYLRGRQDSDGTPDYNVYIILALPEDSIKLPEVPIYVYRTPDEIRTAMLNLPSSDNEAMRAARRNVSAEQLAALMTTLPVDEAERASAAQQLYYLNYSRQNMATTAPIFDPVAVYRLIDYLSSKSRQKRDKKTYNYWPDGD